MSTLEKSILIIFFLCSCRGENPQVNNVAHESYLIIKDSADYSSLFIDQFKKIHSKYNIILLKSDTIALYNCASPEKKSIITFPHDLKLRREFKYLAAPTNGETGYYTLLLSKFNYSSIDYKIKKANEIMMEGIIHLNPLFYKPRSKESEVWSSGNLYSGVDQKGEKFEMIISPDGKEVSLLISADTTTKFYKIVYFIKSNK